MKAKKYRAKAAAQAALRGAVEFVKHAAPVFMAGTVAGVQHAHAGPIQTALTQIGQDGTAGMIAVGATMIAWGGMRIYMDEHHSLNPGRVVGILGGSLFVFGAPAIQAWATGW